LEPAEKEIIRSGSMDVYLVENTDPFIISCGGIPTYIKNITYYLKRRDIKTFFIGSVLNSDTNIKGVFDGIYNISNKKIGHLKFLFKLLISFPRIKTPSGSIIHSQRADLCLPFILYSSRNKIICTSHGNQGRAVTAKRGRIQGIIFFLLERIAVSKVDHFIVVDKKNEEYFKNKYPKYSSKIIRIPIGIDFERFIPLNKDMCRKKYGFPEENKIILFIGRLEEEKNLKLLLDAFKIISRRNAQDILLIIGSGSLEGELKSYALLEGLNNVVFYGALPYEEIPYIINCSNLLVLTSIFEGSPTVIKEALACNVPVVSTNCGDVEEVIRDLENCFISPYNATDFANSVIQSLSDNNLYDYRSRLTQYSNESLFNKLLLVYQN
jgi:glycosyltransferase involved in cell wall biosynthesis